MSIAGAMLELSCFGGEVEGSTGLSIRVVVVVVGVVVVVVVQKNVRARPHKAHLEAGSNK